MKNKKSTQIDEVQVSEQLAQANEVQVSEQLAQTKVVQVNEKLLQTKAVQVIETIVARAGESEDAPNKLYAQYWDANGNALGEVEINN